MNLQKVNKWSAEKLRISFEADSTIIEDHAENLAILLQYGVYELRMGDEWTIEDARCREIVREHFKICTDWDCNDNAYICEAEIIASNTIVLGKTIAEAEIACIIAIMESE